jgi:hypothetical protein
MRPQQGPQKAQKAQTTELDHVIDRVAARLTRVDDDPLITARIVAALPDRSPWRGWLFDSWVPRLAVLAIIITGGILWSRTAVKPVTEPPLAALASAPLMAPLRAAVEPEPLPKDRPVPGGKAYPDGNVLPDGNAADHEFSLPAMTAVAALDVDALAPADLPEDGPLTIESLEIDALPLTPEYSSR